MTYTTKQDGESAMPSITPEFLEHCGVDLGEYVLADYMPVQHRASHEAAGNAGTWPHNGSSRGLMHVDWVDDEWVNEIRVARAQDVADFGWVEPDGAAGEHISPEQATLLGFLELAEEAEARPDAAVGEQATTSHPEIVIATADGDTVLIYVGRDTLGRVEVLGADSSGVDWPWVTSTIADYLYDRADTDNWSKVGSAGRGLTFCSATHRWKKSDAVTDW